MADIQHSVQIAAKPLRIYPLLATGQGFAEWWAADITESGGAVELGFFNRSTIYRLKKEMDQAPAHAAWLCETGTEWAGTHIVFRLEPKGENTLLRFTHAGWASESEYFVSCNTTWGELLYRLKAAAEGAGRGPLFTAAALAY